MRRARSGATRDTHGSGGAQDGTAAAAAAAAAAALDGMKGKSDERTVPSAKQLCPEI